MNDPTEALMRTLAKVRAARVEAIQREYSVAMNHEKNKLTEVHTAVENLTDTELQGKAREREEYQQLCTAEHTRMLDVLNFLKTQQATVRNLNHAAEVLEHKKEKHREAKNATGVVRLNLIAALKSKGKIDEVLEEQLWKK